MDHLGAEFWGPLFGFLTACVGAARWLVRAYFISKQRTNLQKANLEMTVEKFKSTEAGKFVLSIQGSIDNLRSVVLTHTDLFQKLSQTMNAIQITEKNMTDMMYKLQNQYGNFEQRVSSVTLGAQIISKRLDAIETEVIKLSPDTGNIFVRNKKQKEDL